MLRPFIAVAPLFTNNSLASLRIRPECAAGRRLGVIHLESPLRTIHKFPLKLPSRAPMETQQTIVFPNEPQILDVHIQNDDLFVWAIVDTIGNPTKVEFRIVGTGWPIDDGELWRFVGTVHDGPFVWHIFRLP